MEMIVVGLLAGASIVATVVVCCACVVAGRYDRAKEKGNCVRNYVKPSPNKGNRLGVLVAGILLAGLLATSTAQAASIIVPQPMPVLLHDSHYMPFVGR